MTIRKWTLRECRERAGRALLQAGSELAFDQRALERGLATVPSRTAAYDGAQGAVAMARWVDSALLWLGWRVLPSALASVLETGDRSAA
jgi:hypothetical protein